MSQTPRPWLTWPRPVPSNVAHQPLGAHQGSATCWSDVLARRLPPPVDAWSSATTSCGLDRSSRGEVSSNILGGVKVYRACGGQLPASPHPPRSLSSIPGTCFKRENQRPCSPTIASVAPFQPPSPRQGFPSRGGLRQWRRETPSTTGAGTDHLNRSMRAHSGWHQNRDTSPLRNSAPSRLRRSPLR